MMTPTMHRLPGWPGFAAALLAAAAVFGGCSSQAPPAFPSVHQGPRVFVDHTPIWPQAGDSVRVVARGEPGIADARIGDLEISVYTGTNEDPILTRECRLEPLSVAITCELEFEQPSVRSIAYLAEMQVAADETVESPIFTYDTRPGVPTTDRLYALRAPFHRRGAAFKIVLLRACGARQPLTSAANCRAQYADAPFLEDVEAAINGQVHRDPVLRWRSQQLAWYFYGRAGQVASVDSGLTARCGGDPWPSERLDIRLPELLRDADVLGSLHRQGTEQDPFRDCAANHAAAPEVATFSASGFSPQTFQHELGHALFGLGDEYAEDELTRDFPGDGVPDPVDCRCCENGDDACSGDRCSEPQPAACFTAEAFCPGLAGDCGNVFATEEACQRFASRLGSRPWIESREGGCEPLCGGAAATDCPCDGTAELWIFDRKNPPPGDADVMGSSEGGPAETGVSHFGPACFACVEVAFCMRWMTALQEFSEDTARLFCEGGLLLTPPDPPP